MVTTLRFEHNGNEILLEAEPLPEGWRVRLPDGSVHGIRARRLPGNWVQISEATPPRPSPSQGEGANAPHPSPPLPRGREQSIPLLGKEGSGEVASGPEQIYRIPFALEESRVLLSHNGQTYRFTPVAGRRASGKTAASSGLLSAPMAGVLADVMVTEGETVAANQPLAVIEAMKVMTTLEAPFAGTIQKVYAQKAERVEHGAPVVEVVAADRAEREPEHE